QPEPDRDAAGRDRAAVDRRDRPGDIQENAAPARAVATSPDPHARAAAGAARHARDRTRLDPPADDPLVARVDDDAVRADVVEEARLRLDIAAERAVVVPVLEGRDAGEGAEREVEAVDPVLDQPVAGHRHGAD